MRKNRDEYITKFINLVIDELNKLLIYEFPFTIANNFTKIDVVSATRDIFINYGYIIDYDYHNHTKKSIQLDMTLSDTCSNCLNSSNNNNSAIKIDILENFVRYDHDLKFCIPYVDNIKEDINNRRKSYIESVVGNMIGNFIKLSSKSSCYVWPIKYNMHTIYRHDNDIIRNEVWETFRNIMGLHGYKVQLGKGGRCVYIDIDPHYSSKVSVKYNSLPSSIELNKQFKQKIKKFDDDRENIAEKLYESLSRSCMGRQGSYIYSNNQQGSLVEYRYDSIEYLSEDIVDILFKKMFNSKVIKCAKIIGKNDNKNFLEFTIFENYYVEHAKKKNIECLFSIIDSHLNSQIYEWPINVQFRMQDICFYYIDEIIPLLESKYYHVQVEYDDRKIILDLGKIVRTKNARSNIEI